ncbi:MAG: XdhC family protein [Actinomycetota bacterium]
MAKDLFEQAGELSRRGEAFVFATVVWVRRPSSGKAGYKAIVTPEGRIHGWVAGACTEPVVIREALRALEDGSARLVFLGQPEELEGRERDGVTLVPMTCASEGSLEVFVEPVPSRPHLVIIGRSPMVDILASFAAGLDWRTVVVDEGGEEGTHPCADHVVTTLDLTAAGVGDRSAVVVATQGHNDEESLERALTTSAAYIGLVASHKRAASLLGYLRDQGFSEEMLGRVRAPAGLDLGHVTHEEIAVGVMAELVQLRAAGQLAGGYEGTPAQATKEGKEAIDPICQMTVDIASARYRSDYNDRTYYFCCPACRKKFESDPATYAELPS